MDNNPLSQDETKKEKAKNEEVYEHNLAPVKPGDTIWQKYQIPDSEKKAYIKRFKKRKGESQDKTELWKVPGEFQSPTTESLEIPKEAVLADKALESQSKKEEYQAEPEKKTLSFAGAFEYCK
ncbi:MAG: hypothetical protein HUU50_17995 [Candidatus Brocadiae bacterium]|nr:hypothetical protein [Candidatus Brocadiia bacterium]